MNVIVTYHTKVRLQLGIKSIECLLLAGGHQSPILAVETTSVERGSLSSLETVGLEHKPAVLTVHGGVEPYGMV